MNILKRTYVWCSRFRYRKGYGVHSPFAFNLITDVINERRPFYAYTELGRLHKRMSKQRPSCEKRVERLLFRLANWWQPKSVIEVGTGNGLTIGALATGNKKAVCTSVSHTPIDGELEKMVGGYGNVALVADARLDALGQLLHSNVPVGLVHIACTPHYREALEMAIPYVDKHTLIVIQGIHDDKEKRQWWKTVVNDPRIGVTFDLYEVGLLFFDMEKKKQHYVVNF